MSGKVVDALGGFEIGPADGLGELEVSRTGADEGGHMAPAAQHLAEIVAVGTDIESLGAMDPKTDDGEGDFQNFVFIDAHLAGGTFNGFSFPGQLVERNTVLLDGRDHGRNLVEFPGEFGKGGFDGAAFEGGDGPGLKDFAGGVLGIGGFAELEGALVLLVLGHEQILNAGGLADHEHEEAGGDGIERAAVANLALLKASTDEVDNIMGGLAGGLVDEQ